MNAHPTEFRTPSDRRAQIELERLLAARRAAEAAREARFRRLPTPEQPIPANFCAPDDDAPKPLTGKQMLFIASAWLACMTFALWLSTDQGMSFLAALWGAK